MKVSVGGAAGTRRESRRARNGFSTILARICGLSLILTASAVLAEGSRTLYPASYPAGGFRADLDVTGGAPYAGVTARNQFIYVYAKTGEYIALGSSNRNNGGDIFVYNPQSFGTKGAETAPGTADFTCSAPTPPAGSYSGTGRGYIADRTAELAGPNSADNTVTVANGYSPCAYKVPVTGIYGVRFTAATSGGSGPSGSIATLHVGSATVAAWDVTVRATMTSLTDINARVFTYGFVAFTGGNSRPVYHTLYYVTPDGQRYQQTMEGFDPNGYALWGNTYGFFDNGQPLYKDIRGNSSQVSPGNGNFVAELSAQSPQSPVFFSTIDPTGANGTEVATVLQALGIPLTPPPPSLTNISFNGLQTANQTYFGGGGTFTFTTNNDTSYQIVISHDGVDFDPATTANATLTGIAPDGNNTVVWNGLANDGTAFPVGTFTFQIVGRNGEIHFPMVDDEGSVIGGPVLTKLNGGNAGDHTVYYDDRGYVTLDGVSIGTENSFLCGTSPPISPAPDHSLLGVDSSAQTFSGPNCNGGSGTCYYRYWPSVGNSNTDCASTAGFGDAKALDLWSFQATPTTVSTVIINPQPATATVATSVSVPPTAYPGATVNGTLNYQNAGSADATNTTYTATIGTAGNCPTALNFSLLPGGVTFAYNSSTCVVTFTGMPGTLTAGQSLDFAFSYTAPASGSVPVDTGINADGPISDTATGVTNIIAADVTTTISVPATALPNATVNGTITFSNTAAATATANGVTYSATIGTAGSCPIPVTFPSLPGGVTAGYDNATCQVTLSGMPASLTPGQTLSIGFQYAGPASGSVPVNSAIATSTPETDSSNNTASASTTFVPPNITLAKSAPASVPIGAPFDYTLDLGNSGTVASALTVTVSDVLPAGVIANSATPGTGVAAVNCGALPSAPGATLTCTVTLSAALAPGAANGAASFTINATVTAGVSVTNFASVDPSGGNTPPPPGPGCTPAASCGSATTTVVAPPTLAKAFGAASIALNGSTSLTFTVGNPNAGAALSGVGFTDNLPAGLVVATPNGLSSTCTGVISAVAGSGTITLSGGTLAPAASCQFSVNITGTVPGTFVNVTSPITSTEGGTGGTATDSIDVVGPPTLSKAFGAASIALNGTTSLTFNVGNPNAGTALNGIGFTDTLPAGLVVAAPNGLSNTCSGTVTATAGTGTVTLSGASLGAGASCQFSIDVTGTTPGTKNNTTGAITSTEGGTGGTASASTSVVGPPTLSKAFGAANVPLNGSTSLTFTVGNPNAGAALSGIGFTDNLPAGLVVATPNNFTSTCTGTVTAVAGSGTVMLSGASLAAAGSCQFSIDVTGTTVGTKNNVTGNITSTEGGPGGTASASTAVVAPPTLAKAFGAASIALNGSTSLTFTVGNPNAGAALSGVGFTDNLPAGLVVATPTGLSGTCSGTITAVAGSGVVSLSGANLAAGGSCQFSIDVTGTSVGTKNNVTGAITSTEGGTGGTASASTQVIGPPTLSKAFGAASIVLNGTTSLTFNVGNPNAGTALSGIGFTDNLPAGLVVATPNGLSNTCTGTVTAAAGSGTVTLSGASLAASGTCQFSVNVTGTTTGTKNNITGAITSTEGGTGGTASASTTVIGPPTLSKAFGAASMALNGTTSLTFDVGNPNAGSALSGIGFTDNLPAGLVVATPNGLSNTCTGTVTAAAGSGSVSLSGASLAASGTCQFSVNVTGTTTGTKNNVTGAITSTEGGSGGTATASVDVLGPPTLSKAFGAASIPLNGSTSLTFNLGNPNAGMALSGIGFTDNLPAGLIVATPNGLSSTCTGTVTATAGSGAITLSGANLAAGGSCQFSVNVTGTTTGTKNNVTGAITSTEGGTGGTATANTEVVGPPTLSKAFGVASIALNGSTSLTFNVGNPNAGAALSGIGFTDNLPAGLVVATPNGLSSTCTGTVTATAGSGTVTLAGAGLAAGASCQFSVNVTGTTAGTKNNVTGAITSTEGGTGGTATANLDVVAPPTIAKAFGAASVALNGSTSLTFNVGNPNAGSALSGIGFTDNLPAGLVVATPNGLSSTCTGTVTATAGSSTVTLASAGLAAGASCQFSVNVTGTTAGTKNNVTGNVTSTEGGSGGTATANLDVVAPPTIAKAFGVSSLPVNTTTTLTLTIGNPAANTVALNGVSITDNFPAGLVVATPNNLVNNCGGTATAVAGSGSVTLTGGSIAVSGNCTITLSVMPTATGTLVNTTGAVGSTNGGNGGTATDSLDVGAPVVAVTKSGPASVNINATLNYTLTLSNSGNAVSASTLIVEDQLPTGVVATAVASGSGVSSVNCGTLPSAAGALLNCTVTLSTPLAAAGGTAAFGMTATAPNSAGSITNYAATDPPGNGGPPATPPGSTCNPATTSCGSTTTDVTAPQLTVTKTANPNPFVLGLTGTYTVTVQNTGTAATSGNISLTDTLPTGITLTTTSGSNWSCTGTTALNCTFTGTLAPNASTSLILLVSIGANATTGDNSATASGGGDPDCPAATHCTGTVIDPVRPQSTDLRVLKTGPANAVASGTISYTITVTNDGPDAATNVVVTDPTPAGLTFLSAGAPCSGGFPCAIGTLLNGQSVVIANVIYSIAGTQTGTVVNTASAIGDQNDPTPNNNSSSTSALLAPAPPVEPTPIDPRWLLLMGVLLAAIGAARMRRSH